MKQWRTDEAMSVRTQLTCADLFSLRDRARTICWPSCPEEGENERLISGCSPKAVRMKSAHVSAPCPT